MKPPSSDQVDLEPGADSGTAATGSDRRRDARAHSADDGPIESTRRRVLGGVAGAATLGLAGCSSLGGGGGGGGGADTDWAEWVPAGLIDTDRPEAQAGYFDLDGFSEEFPASYTDRVDFGSIARDFGLSEGDLDRVISISESATTEHVVLLGSFAASTVVDSFSAEPATYQGYDVLGGQLAVDDGVVVAGSANRHIVDAYEGGATNLLEAGGEWPAAVENASSGTIGAVEPADRDDPWEISGIAVTGDGGETVSVTAYAHFSSADAAASNQGVVEEDVSTPDDPDDTPITVDSVTVNGNVVVVEGTSQAEDL